MRRAEPAGLHGSDGPTVPDAGASVAVPTALEMYLYLLDRGLTLTVKGGRLHVDPYSRLDEWDKAQIRANREELIRLTTDEAAVA